MKAKWLAIGLALAVLCAGCTQIQRGVNRRRPADGEASAALPEAREEQREPQAESQPPQDGGESPQDHESEPEAENSGEPDAEESTADERPAPGGAGPRTEVFSIQASGNAISSNSFAAQDGQTLVLEIESTISGGTVDFFLFSPGNQEVEHLTLGAVTETRTVELSKGTWAYNCTGFFSSGELRITGYLESELTA